MGRPGLLPICRWWRVRRSLRHLAQKDPAGITIAVDGHVLLHEFVAKYAHDVLVGDNLDVVASAVLERCRRYMAWGCAVTLDFDGKKPLGKALTTEARAAQRLKHLAEAERLLGLGEEAEIDRSLLRSAVAVDEKLGMHVIDHLVTHGWTRYMSLHAGHHHAGLPAR